MTREVQVYMQYFQEHFPPAVDWIHISTGPKGWAKSSSPLGIKTFLQFWKLRLMVLAGLFSPEVSFLGLQMSFYCVFKQSFFCMQTLLSLSLKSYWTKASPLQLHLTFIISFDVPFPSIVTLRKFNTCIVQGTQFSPYQNLRAISLVPQETRMGKGGTYPLTLVSLTLCWWALRFFSSSPIQE